jgi:hypothetical protein
MVKNRLAATTLKLGALLLAAPLLFATDAAAQDRRIRLINESSMTIREFYASNVNRRGWEEDILGRRQIPPGRSMVINLDDGSGHCRFDFKTVMSNGRSIEKRNVDVCRLETYRITN